METAIVIAQFAIKYGIPAAESLVEMFRKPEPTLADWSVVFDKAKKSYEQYAPPIPGVSPGA